MSPEKLPAVRLLCPAATAQGTGREAAGPEVSREGGQEFGPVVTSAIHMPKPLSGTSVGHAKVLTGVVTGI